MYWEILTFLGRKEYLLNICLVSYFLVTMNLKQDSVKEADLALEGPARNGIIQWTKGRMQHDENEKCIKLRNNW